MLSELPHPPLEGYLGLVHLHALLTQHGAGMIGLEEDLPAELSPANLPLAIASINCSAMLLSYLQLAPKLTCAFLPGGRLECSNETLHAFLALGWEGATDGGGGTAAALGGIATDAGSSGVLGGVPRILATVRGVLTRERANGGGLLLLNLGGGGSVGEGSYPNFGASGDRCRGLKLPDVRLMAEVFEHAGADFRVLVLLRNGVDTLISTVARRAFTKDFADAAALYESVLRRDVLRNQLLRLDPKFYACLDYDRLPGFGSSSVRSSVRSSATARAMRTTSGSCASSALASTRKSARSISIARTSPKWSTALSRLHAAAKSRSRACTRAGSTPHACSRQSVRTSCARVPRIASPSCTCGGCCTSSKMWHPPPRWSPSPRRIYSFCASR